MRKITLVVFFLIKITLVVHRKKSECRKKEFKIGLLS